MRRSSISWNSRRAKPNNSLQWTVAAGHERVRLAGQVLPGQTGPVRQAQPLLHRGALVGVETLALTRGDQLVDAYPGQLDHEVPPHEHREDLAVDPQAARAEPAVHQLVIALIRADPPCHSWSLTPTSDRTDRRESLPSGPRFPVNTSTDQNVRVAAPLFTTDARDLHLLARPKWQRRVLAWVLPVAAGVLAGLHTTAVGEPVCTSQSPCRPDALGTVAIGLLFGAAFAGFMYARLAPWIAAGFVVSLIVSERVFQPASVSPAWLYIVDAGFVGLCVLVAGVSRDRRPTDRALQWLV